VGLIEEKFSVLMERKRAQPNVAMSSGSSARSLQASRNVPVIGTPADVGIAAELAIWDAIAVDNPPSRETGRRPGGR